MNYLFMMLSSEAQPHNRQYNSTTILLEVQKSTAGARDCSQKMFVIITGMLHDAECKNCIMNTEIEVLVDHDNSYV